MTPLSVRQLRNRLDKLIAEGYGKYPVMVNGGKNPAGNPKVVNREARYIGPSEWDKSTYRLAEDGTGWTAIL